MSMNPRPSTSSGAARVATLSLGALLLGGCLEKPGIEDTWTRIDVLSSNVSQGEAFAPGAAPTISVRANVIFRRIVTGYAVTELRASSTIAVPGAEVNPSAPRLRMATDIDDILLHSVTAGRMTRAVTGWDHLIQTIDFSFTGAVPATVDSAGVSTGATSGLFLLTYLGSGEKIEHPDGSDTLIVTPFSSGPYQILPVGMVLSVGTGTP